MTVGFNSEIKLKIGGRIGAGTGIGASTIFDGDIFDGDNAGTSGAIALKSGQHEGGGLFETSHTVCWIQSATFEVRPKMVGNLSQSERNDVIPTTMPVSASNKGPPESPLQAAKPLAPEQMTRSSSKVATFSSCIRHRLKGITSVVTWWSKDE